MFTPPFIVTHYIYLKMQAVGSLETCFIFVVLGISYFKINLTFRD